MAPAAVELRTDERRRVLASHTHNEATYGSHVLHLATKQKPPKAFPRKFTHSLTFGCLNQGGTKTAVIADENAGRDLL